ncbi:DUF1934 domain-containing protein [Anaerosporobacter faecicola]|uniref:DUF1934 domain-containing protein n=1 Tax=Anaerosporobacter faecicola TaxID=2718714 RepID=UPI00143A1B2A|nr:DUF1934 domain-containing protein [Anaerosporobacter faecicola]
MTKDVLVTIAGLQFEIDSEEPIEVITTGQYFLKNEKHYILYDEILDDTKEVCKNRIKIGKDSVEILKSGASNVHMVFETNKKNLTYYNTPFGSLLIGIDTTKIACKEKEEEIELYIEYGLEVNYSHVSDCKITVRIAAKKEINAEI